MIGQWFYSNHRNPRKERCTVCGEERTSRESVHRGNAVMCIECDFILHQYKQEYLHKHSNGRICAKCGTGSVIYPESGLKLFRQNCLNCAPQQICSSAYCRNFSVIVRENSLGQFVPYCSFHYELGEYNHQNKRDEPKRTTLEHRLVCGQIRQRIYTFMWCVYYSPDQPYNWPKDVVRYIAYYIWKQRLE